MLEAGGAIAQGISDNSTAKQQAREHQTIVQDLVKALAVRDSELKAFSSELRSRERQVEILKRQR
jgi:hypothetical protein